MEVAIFFFPLLCFLTYNYRSIAPDYGKFWKLFSVILITGRIRPEKVDPCRLQKKVSRFFQKFPKSARMEL